MSPSTGVVGGDASSGDPSSSSSGNHAQDGADNGEALPAGGVSSGDEAATDGGSGNGGKPLYEEGTVLVTLADSVTPEQALATLEQETGLADLAIEEVNEAFTKFTFSTDSNVPDAIGRIEQSSVVADVQPNFYYYPQEGEETASGAAALAQTVSGGSSLIAGSADGLGVGAQAATTINDPRATKWMYSSIEAYDAWDYMSELAGSGGLSPVTVAVMDTAFVTGHEDFAGSYVDVGTGSPRTGFINPYDAVAGAVTSDLTSSSTSYHGQHVAGIIAAHANNGKGVAGVTNNRVSVMPIKVTNDSNGGSITTGTLVKAYQYLVGGGMASRLNVRVVNISLGSGRESANVSNDDDDDDRQVYNAITDAYNQGIVTVAAACNVSSSDTYGKRAPFYCFPGDGPNVVTVVNVRDNGSGAGAGVPGNVSLVSSSNYNVPGQTTKNIAAPGNSIASTYGAAVDDYRTDTGTSMATPVVSGVLALMFAADSSLTAEEAVARLYASTVDVGDAGWDEKYGYGEVNAKRALLNYITGDPNLFVGGSGTYQLAFSDRLPSTATCAWSIDESSTGAATISGSGTSATLAATGAGTVVVKATVSANGGSYTVTYPVKVYSAQITGNSEMFVGGSGTVNLAFDPETPEPMTCSWSIDSSSTAPATVSGSGTTATITATGVGTVVVKAVVSAFGKTYTVTSAPITVQSAEIAGDSNLFVGGSSTYQLTVDKGLPASATYLWSIDGSSTGRATIAGSGKSATVKATGAGTVVLKVAIVADGQTYTVRSSPITVYSAQISGASSLFEGASGNYKLTFANGMPASMTCSWSIDSSSTGGATVTGSGASATVKATRAGSVTLKAVVSAFGKTYTVTSSPITVYSAAVTGSSSLVVADRATYSASSSLSSAVWTFASSNSSVLQMSSNGSATALKPGTATVTATLVSDSTVKRTQSVTVNAIDLKNDSGMHVSYSRPTYSGSQLKPALTVGRTGAGGNTITLSEGTDFTISWGSNIDAGTSAGNFTLTGKSGGRCTNSSKYTFNIAPASIANASVTLSPTSYVYDGTSKKPAATVVFNGRTLRSGTDYSLGYANNLNVGTATATVTGRGNFTGSKDATFKIAANAIADAAKSYGVRYCSYVQGSGWQGWRSNGATSGASRTGLRMEALLVSLTDHPYGGSITYRTYSQSSGWQGWMSDGGMAGAAGQGMRIEALQVKLTGQMASHYDVYYRVRTQGFGWMNWAKNGASAGTMDYGYRVEAVQVKLVPKGQGAPAASPAAATSAAFKHRMVRYRAHVQNIGWQGWKADGAKAGTSGKSLRMEAINLKLGSSLGVSGGIRYRAHVQNIGWQGWRYNGKLAGTSGRSLRMEAIRIQLTGDVAKKYDVYYRVHAQRFGWMGWAKNGAPAGTAGYAYRLESIQVKLVPKGAAAPGSTAKAYRSR